MADHKYVVIGGGLIGYSIAYGLSRRGEDVLVLDEGDIAVRAAWGNFGLIWVQGKGAGFSPYFQWTNLSASRWPELVHELTDLTGIDLEYENKGGIRYCLTETEMQNRAAIMEQLREQEQGRFSFEVLDQKALRSALPMIGPAVVGGIYCPKDAHVNPLALLRSLHTSVVKKGGKLLSNINVRKIRSGKNGIVIDLGDRTLTTNKLILAAGLGTQALAEQFDMAIPVRPNRGQMMITERMEPFLDYPSTFLRQTGAGTVQIGDSHEDVGFESGVSIPVLARISARAVSCFPILEQTRILRSWSCFRTMTPDGYPIYEQSKREPHLFAAVAHSGVTLTPVHVYDFIDAIIEGRLSPILDAFTNRRFDVH